MPRQKIPYGDEEQAFGEPGETDDDVLTTQSSPPLVLERKAPTSFDPQEQLAQLLQIMQSYRDAGMIQQRADGSFLLPGQQDSRWEERLKVGSTCFCPACTPHNQRHWICMVCASSHEWVLVNDRPRTMRTSLGQGGVSGFVHLVCSNECALEYSRRVGLGDGVALVPGVEQPVKIAGGDDDPTGFFSAR